MSTETAKSRYERGICMTCDAPRDGSSYCGPCWIKQDREGKAARRLLQEEYEARRAVRRALGISITKRSSAELKLRAAAHAFTRRAVRLGFLADPKDCKCADCGRQAECYDHRDYSRPLDVEPVCICCNSSRGRGVMPALIKAAA